MKRREFISRYQERCSSTPRGRTAIRALKPRASVQAARVRGRPVQRHLAYLGGITEADAKDVGRRVQFWEKASEELDALGDQLSTEERRKIESRLASRVQRPTARERREQQRQRQQQREQQDETLQRILELETELEAEREHLLGQQTAVVASRRSAGTSALH